MTSAALRGRTCWRTGCTWRRARATPAAEQALLAAEHAHHAGDAGPAVTGARPSPCRARFPGRHDAATIAQKLEAIESEDSGPYVAAFVALVRGEVERLQGHFGAARRLTQNAIEQFRAMGHPTYAAACQHPLAWLELSAGEPARALPGLLEADASLAEVGERSFRSTVHAILAEVYESLGDRDGARAAIELSDELGGEDDLLNIVITHAVRARLALADGDLNAAERWARSAVEHAFSTDNTFLQGNAQLAARARPLNAPAPRRGQLKRPRRARAVPGQGRPPPRGPRAGAGRRARLRLAAIRREDG